MFTKDPGKFAAEKFTAGVSDDFNQKILQINAYKKNFGLRFFYVRFGDEPNSILTLRDGTRFVSRLTLALSKLPNLTKSPKLSKSPNLTKSPKLT